MFIALVDAGMDPASWIEDPKAQAEQFSALLIFGHIAGAAAGYLGNFIESSWNYRLGLKEVLNHATQVCKNKLKSSRSKVSDKSYRDIIYPKMIRLKPFQLTTARDIFSRNVPVFINGNDQISLDDFRKKGYGGNSVVYIFDKSLECADLGPSQTKPENKGQAESTVQVSAQMPTQGEIEESTRIQVETQALLDDLAKSNLGVNHDKIADLVTRGKLQEAMWLLPRDPGSSDLYERFKNELKRRLQSNYYEEMSHQLGGVTLGKKLLKFPGGIRAIFKPESVKSPMFSFNEKACDSADRYIGRFFGISSLTEAYHHSSNMKYWASSSLSELGSFLVDEELGFQLTPITISFTTRDGKTGSLQYFVDDVITAERYIHGFEESKRNEVSSRADFVLLALFDQIIANIDRNSENILVWTPADKIVAIDHGLALRGSQFGGLNKNGDYILKCGQKLDVHQLSPWVLDRIQSFNPKEFSVKAKNILSGSVLKDLIQRIDALKEFLRKSK